MCGADAALFCAEEEVGRRRNRTVDLQLLWALEDLNL
jgi:hypothetical protein